VFSSSPPNLAVDDFGADSVEKFAIVGNDHHGDVLQHQERLQPLHLTVHAYTSTADCRKKVCTCTYGWIGNLKYQEVEKKKIYYCILFFLFHKRQKEWIEQESMKYNSGSSITYTDSKSKWLVGSSSSKTLGSESKIFPRPMRIFQPPLKLDTGRFASSGMKPIWPSTRSTCGQAIV